ncbi:hypothetical protein HanXRQr2_Chr06g0272971 [Helianthus annuus]|uniref:Uncharacterized protein n=1 Tax=Helianthus annuus TaxID=4232 RepID=A0A9K3IUW6_HELAN|nr:hypothetical protein HanXRQr2_Chr06g0272971 [Helianthus annuus]KAJ0916587.1 hypothetical protein HanPSC8_Chr06g0263461 [Helianthus annuus]
MLIYLVTNGQFPRPFISLSIIKTKFPHRRNILHSKQHKVRERDIGMIIQHQLN